MQQTYVVTVLQMAFDNAVPGNSKEFLGKQIQDTVYSWLVMIQKEWHRHAKVVY